MIAGEMISRYKNFLYYGLLGVAVMTLLVVRFWKTKKHDEADFVSAKTAFQKWVHGNDRNHESLNMLENMLKKHPELSPQYESLIGQQLLASGSASDGKSYLEHVLTRAAHPYYSDFAKTSVTIVEGNFSKALDEANSLKTKMQEELATEIEKGSLLHAFNLLRIAMLQGELLSKAGELSAWGELRQYAGWESGEQKSGKEVCSKLLSHLTIQQRSLLDYIAFRENLLTH